MRKCKSTQPDTMNSDHLLAVICIKVLGSSEYALTHGEALISKNLWLPVRKKKLDRPHLPKSMHFCLYSYSQGIRKREFWNNAGTSVCTSQKNCSSQLFRIQTLFTLLAWFGDVILMKSSHRDEKWFLFT